MVSEFCVLFYPANGPTNVFHEINIKSFLSIVESIFFYVNICRPTHHKSAYNSFSQFGLFGYCDWLINQIPTYVHCGSWSAETNSSYRFRFSLCWSRASFPCSNRHLVIFLPPLTKELDRCSQNALHLYPLLQRIWFQQAMVLQASV